ncbi:MAG TPA: hypothetical protein VHR45_13715 [Thermoanaerobaculia bacterium]|nr:hypothetical protein [Thermoanaerobaculia bacterium]
MSEKKGWGSSVLGLIFVRDKEGADSAQAPAAAEPGSPSPSDTAAPYGAARPEPGAELATDAPAASGGRVDFAAVYAAAGIDAEEQARVAKAAELLQTLPSGSEPARQIVEASLKAFGVAVDKIIAAGEKEMRALDAYAAAAADATRQVLAESQQRIAQYEQEIQHLRQAMDERVAEEQRLEQACSGGKLQVARVLEFFGHAPGSAAPNPSEPSKRSS